MYYYRNTVMVQDIEPGALWASNMPKGLLTLVDDDQFVQELWSEDKFEDSISPKGIKILNMIFF